MAESLRNREGKPKFQSKKSITFQNDWCGGRYLLDGEEFLDIERRPFGFVVIDDKIYPAQYETYTGIDYDHGHEYPWTRMDIGIEVPHEYGRVFLPVRKFDKKYKIQFIKDNQ